MLIRHDYPVRSPKSCIERVDDNVQSRGKGQQQVAELDDNLAPEWLLLQFAIEYDLASIC